MGYARTQTEPFSLDAVLRELGGGRTGGVAFYVGTVRGDDDGHPVESLTYEAYPEMATATLERLRTDAVTRFHLTDAIVIHRLGRVAAGEPILVVALAGAHRRETFEAVANFMDRLKEIVPIWKKEDGPTGASWIVGQTNRRVTP